MPEFGEIWDGPGDNYRPGDDDDETVTEVDRSFPLDSLGVPDPLDPAEIYRENLLSLVGSFEFMLCEECGEDINRHTISPDPLGNPHAWCMAEETGHLCGENCDPAQEPETHPVVLPA